MNSFKSLSDDLTTHFVQMRTRCRAGENAEETETGDAERLGESLRRCQSPRFTCACDGKGIISGALLLTPIDSEVLRAFQYNELILRGCNVDVGVVPVTVREGEKVAHRQYEIDFVVNVGVDKVYVQSAFAIPDEEKLRQETRSLRESKDFFRKIVVRDGFMPPLADEEGIVHVGVVPFLLDPTVLTGR